MTIDATIGLANISVATQAEAEAGVIDNKAMTPLKTAQAIAALGGGGGSFTVASQAEAEAGSENTKGLTSLRGKQAIDAQRPYASQAEAEAGVNSTKVMTAQRTAQAIAALAPSGGGGVVDINLQNFRITPQTGNPFTTSDVSSITTLYFSPCNGNRISLYASSIWSTLTSNEFTFAVPATTNTMYDVFAYNNSGTVDVELLAWTNDTTRATALARQDGVLVKSGDATRRYVGSIRTTGTSGQTEDSKAKRYIWNFYNRSGKLCQKLESTTSWTYSTATWRQANNSTANQIDFIIGVSEDTVIIQLASDCSNSTSTTRYVYTGYGVNSATAPSGFFGAAPVNNATGVGLFVNGCLQPAVGRTYVAWLEQGAGTDTQTWYGINTFGVQATIRG